MNERRVLTPLLLVPLILMLVTISFVGSYVKTAVAETSNAGQFVIAEAGFAMPDASAEIKISYIVQPDRINNVVDNNYDIWSFQNDEITFAVYLTNIGDTTAENVTATLRVPEGLGFSLTNDTAYYGNIEPQNISIGNLSFSTNNVSVGFYDLTLNVSHQDVNGSYSFESNIPVKIVDVGVFNMKHLKSSRYTNTSQELFLRPIDSKVLGYSAMFASENVDSFVLVVKNGKSKDIENLSIEILPQNSLDISFKVSEGETFIGGNLNVSQYLFGQGAQRGFIIDVTTNNIEIGIYNFTVTLTYIEDNITYITNETLSFGIYDIALLSSINTISNAGSTKSFAVQTDITLRTPNQDNISINANNFDLINITKPINCAFINESIKEIVENIFPLYYSNSNIIHNKSDWLKAYLLNKTKGEINVIGKAILNDFGFIVGNVVGYELVWGTASKLLEREGFNAAIELESEGAAGEAGFYYGEVVIDDALSDETFFNNYTSLLEVDDPVIVPTEPISPLTDIQIFLDLSTVSNVLPIYWTAVYDEDTTFTRNESGWDDINIDNLPATFILNFTQFREEYNITEVSFRVSIIMKPISSNMTTLLYERNVVGNSSALNIDRLEKSDYYNTVVVVHLGMANVSGVSESLIFRVTDPSPPEKKHDDVLDYLSERDLQIMNNVGDCFSESTIVQKKYAKITSDNYIFEKSTPEYKGANVSLLSTYYNSPTNKTMLTFNITANETKDFTLNVSTYFIENYANKDNKIIVEENITTIDLTANVPSTISVEVTGRFGYDFNDIEVHIHGSVSTIITFIGLVVSLTQLGGQAALWGVDEFNITINTKPLEAYPQSVYVGERFEPSFLIHYKAKGGDYNERYDIWYEITPGKDGWSGIFVGGADHTITALYRAIQQDFCKPKPDIITVVAKVYQISKFYSSKDVTGWKSGCYSECKYGPYLIADAYGRGIIVDYKCTFWRPVKGPKTGKLTITIKNPLPIESITPNPVNVMHLEPTEVSVLMQYAVHTSSTDFHIVPSPLIKVTAVPIVCAECSVTPTNLPLTIIKDQIGTAKLKVTHTGPPHLDTKTIILTIKECTVEGNGEKEGEPWSVKAPDFGDRISKFICKGVSGNVSYCGDGILQPELDEECDPGKQPNPNVDCKDKEDRPHCCTPAEDNAELCEMCTCVGPLYFIPVFPNWYAIMTAVVVAGGLGYLIWRRRSLKRG